MKKYQTICLNDAAEFEKSMNKLSSEGYTLVPNSFKAFKYNTNMSVGVVFTCLMEK